MSIVLNGTSGITSPAIDLTTPLAQADGGTAVSSIPAFRAVSTGATSVTASNNKVLYANDSTAGVAWDTANCYDTTNSRFTPNVAGYYLISGSVVYASTTYRTGSFIYKNGAQYCPGNFATDNASTISALVYLNGSTDYVELWGFSATTQNTQTGSNQSFFSGVLVRAA